MYTHVVEHKAFTYLGTQKHGEQQGTFLGTLLILLYIYIFFASWNFENLCSVLNLLISHMTWIASSNEFTALICYVFVYIYNKFKNSTREPNCGKV